MEPIGDPHHSHRSRIPRTSLTYSLTCTDGTDADSFDINSSTGQIETLADLDYETKETYHLAVSVRDSKDIDGNPDSTEDDSIDVTINVIDVNEPPDPPATPSVTPKTGTTGSLDVSWTAPDTEGKPTSPATNSSTKRGAPTA